MNELIWFSVPGAVGLYALHLAFPGNSSNGGLLVIASAPILGFILHQLYRTVFEACHGWETIRRPVLTLIKKEYNLDDANPRLPFLIWETSFYSDGVPDSFRENNRSGWHYVMSFRSIAFASAIAGIALACIPAFWQSTEMPGAQIGLFGALALLFWLKGRLTYSSLTDQECAAFRRYRPAFDSTRETMPKPTKREDAT